MLRQIGVVKGSPPPSKYTLMYIDTNSVHNATVCVDFVKHDTFLGTSFVDNLPKSCFLFAFPPTKLLATSTRFISRNRLRNFYHSIGEIKIDLFLRLVLKQHDELKACSKYTAVA